MNALYGAGRRESYVRIYDSLPEQAKRDYRASNRYWKQFETKVAEVSTSLNDHYLKANAQSDGVQSYGRMVDLLLAERRSGCLLYTSRNRAGVPEGLPLRRQGHPPYDGSGGKLTPANFLDTIDEGKAPKSAVL